MFSIIWNLFVICASLIVAVIVYAIFGGWPFVGLALVLIYFVWQGFDNAQRAKALPGPAGVCEQAQALYNQLQDKQTYDQVCLLAGHRGQLKYRGSVFKGESSTSTWTDGAGGEVRVSFINGRLDSKDFYAAVSGISIEVTLQ
jgi:hypothetical protein